jgi:hypothetical protein
MSDELSLQDRMEIVLRDQRNIKELGARSVAYVRAGIDFRFLSYEEISRADEAALSTELARRLNDASPE